MCLCFLMRQIHPMCCIAKFSPASGEKENARFFVFLFFFCLLPLGFIRTTQQPAIYDV